MQHGGGNARTQSSIKAVGYFPKDWATGLPPEGKPNRETTFSSCRLTRRPREQTFRTQGIRSSPIAFNKCPAPPAGSAPGPTPFPAGTARATSSRRAAAVPASRGAGRWRSWTLGGTARWSSAGSEVIQEPLALVAGGKAVGRGGV